MTFAIDEFREIVESALGDRSKAGVATASGLPRDAIRNVLEGHEPKLSRAFEICDALDLDFHISMRRNGGSPSTQDNDKMREEIAKAVKAETEALRAEVASIAASLDPLATTTGDSLRRIRESDLVIPTMVFLAAQPSGKAKTSDIIKHLEGRLRPTGEDAEPLKGRSDSRFSQIVRNMISHRNDAGSFIRNGYADYLSDTQGLRITDKGRKLLSELTNVR